jgi:hypothetical protein
MLSTATEQSTPIRTAQLQPLLQLATRGLEHMFHPQQRLFCYKLRQTPQGLIQDGISFRYTIITVLGLHRAERAGLASVFEVRGIFDALARNTRSIDNAGDWGLLLWLSALCAPEELPRLTLRGWLDTLLDRFHDGRERRTMEMAWLLAGLAHIRLADVAGLKELSPLAFRLYRLLSQNQGAEGIFGHQAAGRSYRDRLRSRLGSFADQVYPIYALSKFAQAWGVDEAVCRARRCADTICRLQGPMGQWWWHYDSARGRVVGRYPVYSVHQDGMAPMALLALSEAAEANYEENIYRGLEWIYGANELGADMRDVAANIIWRCIGPDSFRRYSSELLCLAGMSPLPGGLHTLHECRPYHLGWLLYSFCS